MRKQSLQHLEVVCRHGLNIDITRVTSTGVLGEKLDRFNALLGSLLLYQLEQQGLSLEYDGLSGVSAVLTLADGVEVIISGGFDGYEQTQHTILVVMHGLLQGFHLPCTSSSLNAKFELLVGVQPVTCLVREGVVRGF